MQKLIEMIAKSLVDHHEDVCVQIQEGSSTSIIKLEVNKSDIGKIIGKKGANANAIRTILDACGGKDNKRYIFEIIE